MDKIVESLTIVLFLGFILGVIFWDYTRRGREFEQKIHDILLSKGATGISITGEWNTDRHNRTYQVAFTDAHGTRHHTTCKVGIWNGDVYWKDHL